jgi:TPR repeat protein
MKLPLFNTKVKIKTNHLFSVYAKKHNYQKAFFWYGEAAKNDNIVAMNHLAYMYWCGFGVIEDRQKAINLFQRSASRGDVDSQITLGRIYRTGKDVPENLTEAAKWYKMAAKQNSKIAKNCLAKLPDHITKDTDSNLQTTEIKSSQSFRHNLCLKLYEDVDKILAQKDSQKDIDDIDDLKDLARNALVGDGASMYIVGSNYCNGTQFPKDTSIGFKWINKSAKAGFHTAQYDLATTFENKAKNIKESIIASNQYYLNAKKWYQKAAIQNNTDAQWRLGLLYENGHGVAKDLAKAEHWYTESAEKNNPNGQYHLSIMLCSNFIPKTNLKDYEQIKYNYDGSLDETKKKMKYAITLLEASSDQNHPEANYMMGLLCENKFKTQEENALNHHKEDLESAKRCYEKAIRIYKKRADGDLPSQLTLTTIYTNTLFEKYLSCQNRITEDSINTTAESKDSCSTKGNAITNNQLLCIHFEEGLKSEVAFFREIPKAPETYYAVYHPEILVFSKYEVTSRLQAAKGLRSEDDDTEPEHEVEKSIDFVKKSSSKNLFRDDYTITRRQKAQNYRINQKPGELVDFIPLPENGIQILMEQQPKSANTDQLSTNSKLDDGALDARRALAAIFLGEFHINNFSLKNNMIHRNKGIAINYLELASDLGDSKAQYQLACIRLRDSKSKDNYRDAYKLFRTSAENGNSDAKSLFDLHLKTPLSVDPDQFVNMLKNCSQDGTGTVYHQLGLLHEYGSKMIGSSLIQQSYSDALKFYQKATSLEVAQSIYQLGYLYEKGRGVQVDIEEAKLLYERASMKNHADSSYRLGRLHYYGLGSHSDLKKAFDYFTDAAKGGNLQAEEILNLDMEVDLHQLADFERKLEMYERVRKDYNYSYLLGLVYGDKDSPLYDIKAAGSYYTEAKINGTTEAYYRLGQIFEKENKNENEYDNKIKEREKLLSELLFDSKNYAERCLDQCITLYRMASDNGNYDAMFRLGLLYLHGNVVEKKNHEEAFEKFSKAAKLGSLEAKATMDLSKDMVVDEYTFFGKIDLKTHHQESVEMYKSLARSGNPIAQYKLGVFYEEGLPEPNYLMAKEWYLLACDGNHTGALYRLGVIYEEGKGVEKNIQVSISLYTKGADLGCENCLSKMGLFFQESDNRTVNLEKQIDHYQKLAIKGNATAQYITGFLYFESNTVKNGKLESLKWLSKSYQLGNKDVKTLLEKYFDDEINKSIYNLKKKAILDKCIQKETGCAYYKMANFHFYGESDPKKYPEAFKHYWISARKHNNIYAMKYIQLNHKDGPLLPEEIEKLKDMFTEAAKADCSIEENVCWVTEAQYQLGAYYKQQHEKQCSLCHEQSICKVESKELSDAIKYFEMAADLDHIRAGYELAMIYIKRRDNDNAEKYLLDIENKMDSNACYQLGRQYIQTQSDVKRGIDYLQKSAEKGHPIASYHLGLIYKEGKYLHPDHNLAFKYFEQAAKQGHEESQFNLALLYQNGQGTANDYSMALDLYETLAQNGNKRAEIQAGMMYWNGQGTPLDKDKALKTLKKYDSDEYPDIKNFFSKLNERNAENEIDTLKKLASEGDDKARYKLGMVYLKRGDYSEARPYFEAAKNGNKDAHYPLGWLYENGKGVTKNFKRAIGCYIKSNKFGNKELQYKLGLLYKNLDKPDHEKSFSHFKAAGDEGHLGAKYQLGLAYEYGLHTEKNYETAFELYRESACQQNPDSHYRLGLMYAYGHNGKKNISEAIHQLLTYEKYNEFRCNLSLEINEECLVSDTDNMDITEMYNRNIVYEDFESQYNLALMYLNNESTPSDSIISSNFHYCAASKGNSRHQLEIGLIQLHANNSEEGIRWIVKSAEQGNTHAKNVLGVLYMNGEATYYNKPIALQYFYEAAKEYDSNAQFNLGSIHHHGHHEEKNIDLAISWYKKSAEQDCIASQFALGLIYKDQEMYGDSFVYFKEAAENNHADAQYFLGWLYENGYGTEKSIEEAEIWYTRSKSQEDVPTSMVLARLYHYRDDTVQALKWYKKALDSKHVSSAERGLGLIYEYTHRNHSKALEYYIRSADKHNKTAYYELGRMFYHGTGVERNIETALDWFNKIASVPCDDTTEHIFIEAKYSSLVSNEEGELEYRVEFEHYFKAKAQHYMDEARISV